MQCLPVTSTHAGACLPAPLDSSTGLQLLDLNVSVPQLQRRHHDQLSHPSPPNAGCGLCYKPPTMPVHERGCQGVTELQRTLWSGSAQGVMHRCTHTAPPHRVLAACAADAMKRPLGPAVAIHAALSAMLRRPTQSGFRGAPWPFPRFNEHACVPPSCPCVCMRPGHRSSAQASSQAAGQSHLQRRVADNAWGCHCASAPGRARIAAPHTGHTVGRPLLSIRALIQQSPQTTCPHCALLPPWGILAPHLRHPVPPPAPPWAALGAPVRSVVPVAAAAPPTGRG